MTDLLSSRDARAARRRVVRVLRRRVTDWYGPGARLQGDPRFELRTWSVHALAAVAHTGGRVELIVKIPTWDAAPTLPDALAAGPQAATLREFERLAEIRDMVVAAADPGLAAVEPVAYLSDINALVTERLAAVPLRRLLGPGVRPVVAAALGSLGRWLRRYHRSIGGAATAPFSGEQIEAEVAELIDSAVAGRAPNTIRRTLARLELRARELAGSPVTVAVTHGDLGPSNVLVDRAGRVAVIDPNDVPGPVVFDLAKLITAIRTAAPRLLSGIPRPQQPIRPELALLGAYGPFDRDALAVARGMATVRRWLDIEGGAAGLRRVSLLPARRVLRAELSGVLSVLD